MESVLIDVDFLEANWDNDFDDVTLSQMCETLENENLAFEGMCALERHRKDKHGLTEAHPHLWYVEQTLPHKEPLGKGAQNSSSARPAGHYPETFHCVSHRAFLCIYICAAH